MLGINLMQDVDAVKEYRDRHHLTYPLLLDTAGQVWARYGMGFVPHNVVISPDHVVRYTNYGYDEEALVQVIEQWLPSRVCEVRSGQPFQFQLLPVHPNPFRPGNGEVAATFRLPRTAQCELDVYDIRGRVVRRLASGPSPAGQHRVTWDGRDEAGAAVPAGLYFLRLRVRGRALMQRLVVVR